MRVLLREAYLPESEPANALYGSVIGPEYTLNEPWVREW